MFNASSFLGISLYSTCLKVLIKSFAFNLAKASSGILEKLQELRTSRSER